MSNVVGSGLLPPFSPCPCLPGLAGAQCHVSAAMRCDFVHVAKGDLVFFGRSLGDLGAVDACLLHDNELACLISCLEL
eukprot:11745017-Alexandrium_andersonii.AAC.1